ncbi:MAG: BON domain-containing protein [Oculatellaceae cyanobacterium Prado106]|nr:BON domain-containing protein [Oculatellaceae cyanobacterium Prado106]
MPSSKRYYRLIANQSVQEGKKMGWLKRLFDVERPEQVLELKQDSQVQDQQMGPGLTGQYDWNLREKAGAHEPPLPPKHLGLEGEFDQQGLAKRVAAAFDRVPELSSLEAVTIQQSGSSIILEGSVPSQEIRDRLVEIASGVDGTQSVNAEGLAIVSP